MQSTLIMLFVGLLGFGTVVAGGYFYYTTTQTTISELKESNVVLRIASEDNQKAMEGMKEDYRKTQVLSAELEVELQESEKRRNELGDLLQRHNLTRLTLKKPGLIENRINDGTKKTFNDIESITNR